MCNCTNPFFKTFLSEHLHLVGKPFPKFHYYGSHVFIGLSETVMREAHKNLILVTYTCLEYNEWKGFSCNQLKQWSVIQKSWYHFEPDIVCLPDTAITFTQIFDHFVDPCWIETAIEQKQVWKCKYQQWFLTHTRGSQKVGCRYI